MVPGTAASQRDRGQCIAWKQLPGTAALLMPVFQCVFVFASDCTKLKVLLASPLGLLSSAHASWAPLLLAVLGSVTHWHHWIAQNASGSCKESLSPLCCAHWLTLFSTSVSLFLSSLSRWSVFFFSWRLIFSSGVLWSCWSLFCPYLPYLWWVVNSSIWQLDSCHKWWSGVQGLCTVLESTRMLYRESLGPNSMYSVLMAMKLTEDCPYWLLVFVLCPFKT